MDELAKVATYYGFIDSGRMVKEVSAVDMEKEYRKALRIKVESIEKAAIALTSLGNDYSVIDDNTLDVFGDIGIKEVLDVLSGAGIKDIEKRNENLEGYFINTMGGCV